MNFLTLLQKLFKRPIVEAKFIVDDQGVRRVLANGKEERVRWSHVGTVMIQTTADGPFTEGFFWALMERAESGCVECYLNPFSFRLLSRGNGRKQGPVPAAIGSLATGRVGFAGLPRSCFAAFRLG